MYKLIYKESRTNLISSPREFSNAVWNKIGTTVTENATEASDGSVTADKLVENVSGLISHTIEQSVTRDATEYSVFTVELKEAERYDAFIHLWDWTSPGNELSIRVNLSTGEIITPALALGSAVLTDWIFEGVGNGWYIVGVAGIPGPSTGGAIRAGIQLVNSAFGYAGDGVSGFYMCDARIEAASTIRDEIDICPDWNFSKVDEKVQQRHKAVSGIHEVYKYGEFDARKFDLRYVSSSDASIINSWWSSNTEIWLKNMNDFSVFSCMLTNRNTPIGQVIKPYNDQFRGTIELGEY